MSDIVTTCMRYSCQEHGDTLQPEACSACEVAHDFRRAKAEIERLRIDVGECRLVIEQQDRDIERLRAVERFAVRVVREALKGYGVEGDDIQEWGTEAGLLIPTVMTEPCHPESCICAEVGDFPLTCYRIDRRALGGEDSA